MRVKAPKGNGHPCVRGVTIQPDKDGTYRVSEDDGQLLVKSHGYIDADAPVEKQKAAAVASPALHGAVVKALAVHGVSVPDNAGEDILLKALDDLSKIIDERMLAAVKRAEQDVEDRVRNELADKGDKKK